MSTTAAAGPSLIGKAEQTLDRNPALRWVVGGTVVLVAVVALTAIYTRLSMTIPVGSDQANSALQGQDLASGNVLLRGWIMSPLSLYVPDLLLYAMVVSVAGLSPAAVHITNALMYALIVVAAMVLARGAPGSRPRQIAALITGVVLVAPQLGLGADLLVLEGSHVGIALIGVIGLIVIDRAPPRLETAVVVGGVLTVAVIADGLAIVVTLAPLALVSAFRLWRGRLERRYDAALLAVSLLSFPIAEVTLFGVRRVHGFRTYALSPGIANPPDVLTFAGLTVKGVAAMLGIDVTAAHTLVDYGGVALHVVGAMFVIVVVVLVGWRVFQGRERDRVSQLLLVGIGSNVGAFLLTTHQPTSRYLIPSFVFAGVLAGRVGALYLVRLKRRWPMTALAAGYVALLLLSLGAPPAPTIHPWSSWLLEHHLYNGIGSYWQASSVTLETEGKVRVRAILSDGKQANGYAWESKLTWYSADQLGDVRFVIYDSNDHQFGVDSSSMVAVFGLPMDVESFGSVRIMVWDHNLVPEMTLSG